MAILANVQGVSKEIKGILDYLSGIEKKLDTINTKSGKALGGARSVGSRQKVGRANQQFDTSADFSNTGAMPQMNSGDYLANITAANSQYLRASSKMNFIGSAATGVTNILSASFGMMPNVGATVNRATGLYNASVMMGNVSFQRLGATTMMGMHGGITGPGSDAATAAYLAGQGVNFSANPASQYMRTLNSVGNLAQYMNMDNQSAAAAVTGFYSGKGSRMLMQTMGIRTSDPLTGKTRSMGAILTDVGNRLSNGRPMTVEGINDSFLRGNLGVNLRGMGLSPDQQQIVKQFLIEKAKGNNLNLEDPKMMEKIAKSAGVNPQAALQAINASDTKTMQASQDAYIAGLDTAAQHIKALNDVIAQTPELLKSFNAYLATMGGSQAGSGLMNVASSVGNVASAGLQYALMSKLLGGGGGAGAGFAAGAKNLGSSLLKAAPKVAKVGGALAVVGGAMDVAGGIASGNNAQIGRGIGSTAGALIGGAIGQTLIPIPGVGAIIGGTVGSMLFGSLGEAIGGGVGDGEGGSPGAMNSGIGGEESIPFSDPTTTKQLSVAGGYKAGNLGHSGYDYAVKNQPVYAAASGKIIVRQMGTDSDLGRHVVIDHGKIGGKVVYTLYAHLSHIHASGTVKRGQLIATSGATGTNITGAHLHFSVGEGGWVALSSRVNPGKYVSAKGGAGTRPNGTKVPNADGSAVSTTDSQFDGREESTSSEVADSSSSAASAGATVTSAASFSPMTASGESSFASVDATGVHAGSTASSAVNKTSASGVDLRNILSRAGFKGSALSTAYAIAMAESKGKTNKHSQMAGKDTYGLFQIDMSGSKGKEAMTKYKLSSLDKALDPITNAKIAYQMSNGGQDWGSWASYTGGAYKQYLTNAKSASAGTSYVSHDQPINVHAGEAILDATQAKEYRQSKMIAEKAGGANVTINVTVQQASEAEARRLATMVKGYLKDDALFDRMGAK